jgi:hypothetical protein
VLDREPSDRERTLLKSQLAAERAEYRRDPAAAMALLAVGESPSNPMLDPVEHAAWTMIASLVLNLDETVSLR